MINPKCKQCRQAGEKLFLKGDRCYSQKCAFVKRAYAPGIHGRTKAKSRRGGGSEYKHQLSEKQSLKKTYGLLERQFSRYFKEASAERGDTREILMRKLETRLDNVVFRLGLVKSRTAARQLVGHGHIVVNNRRVNIPSYSVQTGDVVALKDKIKKSKLMESLPLTLKKFEPPQWLVLDHEKIEGTVIKQPGAIDFTDLASVGLIVEFYSR